MERALIDTLCFLSFVIAPFLLSNCIKEAMQGKIAYFSCLLLSVCGIVYMIWLVSFLGYIPAY